MDPRYNDPDDIDCLLLLSPDDPLPLMEVPPSAPGLDDITDEGVTNERCSCLLMLTVHVTDACPAGVAGLIAISFVTPHINAHQHTFTHINAHC